MMLEFEVWLCLCIMYLQVFFVPEVRLKVTLVPKLIIKTTPPGGTI